MLETAFDPDHRVTDANVRTVNLLLPACNMRVIVDLRDGEELMLYLGLLRTAAALHTSPDHPASRHGESQRALRALRLARRSVGADGEVLTVEPREAGQQRSIAWLAA